MPSPLKDDRQEIPVSEEELKRILRSSSPDAVLVGGQALAICMLLYQIDRGRDGYIGTISDDVDFLADRQAAKILSTNIRARILLPTEREITALSGRVFVDVTRDTYINIDFIHKLCGLNSEMVRDRSTEIEWDSIQFRVMHPLDILRSRTENLYRIREKRNQKGMSQFNDSAKVANRYLVHLIQEHGEREGLRGIEKVVDIAKSAAGRYVTRQIGLSFLPAIPEDAVRNENFAKIRWPIILDELGAGGEMAGKDKPRTRPRG